MHGAGETRAAARHWMTAGVVDGIVGAAALVAGIAVMYDSARMGAEWTGGTPQPGYFPFRVGAIICIAAAVVIVRAVLRARKGGAAFVPWKRFRRVLAVFGPMIAYIAGIQYLGIYVASALFVAGFMRVAGRYGWVRCLVVGIVSAVVLFWLFEIRFLVPLPKGPLEGWLGY